MEQTQKVQQNTDNGKKSGQPGLRLRLPDLPEYRLGVDGELNGFDATDSEFLHFVQSLVPLTGEGLDHWTWEERRDFLNWCLDEQVLTIAGGRLVPFEEGTPTEPLSHDGEIEAASEAEDTSFLHRVELARPLIQVNPEITSQELADALGLKSAIYAHELKVYIHAEEGA